MLSIYPACFFKENNGYSVIFPDLNNLATCGETVNEAVAMAVDCLAGYLYWLKQEGEAAPAPSSLDKVDIKSVADELEINYETAFVNYISVDVLDYAKNHFDKSVKKTLTIPAWLDTAAVEENINLSQTLQEALMYKLNIG